MVKCIICDKKTEEGNRFPTDDKGHYTDEYEHFWTCETCFGNVGSYGTKKAKEMAGLNDDTLKKKKLKGVKLI